ncbi:transposase [Mediterraneibacter gnavus]
MYDDSKQNYGAPKITVELHKTGEVISERTVGTYMRPMEQTMDDHHKRF